MRCESILWTAVMLLAIGCQNMSRQPRVESYDQPRSFVAGTVPYQSESAHRPALSEEVLNRGEQAYTVHCTPCHGHLGFGHGMAVQRGFPAPPSFHTTRLRKASDGHLFSAMTHGAGRMRAYADQLSPGERWAVVDYVRALQLSQNFPAEELSEEELEQLEGP